VKLTCLRLDLGNSEPTPFAMPCQRNTEEASGAAVALEDRGVSMPKILQARRFGIGRVVTCVSIFTLQTIFFYGQSTKTSAEPSIPARGSAAIADLTPSEVAGQQNYDQPMRPQLHYSVLQGHIGDATGLVSYRGEFHLFNIFDEWAR
jgi:hypothetical protein